MSDQVGVKEIEQLIERLELDKDILADQENDGGRQLKPLRRRPRRCGAPGPFIYRLQTEESRRYFVMWVSAGLKNRPL